MKILLMILGLIFIVFIYKVIKIHQTKIKIKKVMILEHTRLKIELSNLKIELINKKSNNSSLKNENNKLESINKDLLDIISELKDDNRQYSDDLVLLNNKLNEKTNEIKSVNRKIQRIKDENSVILQNNKINNELILELNKKNDKIKIENNKLIEFIKESDNIITKLNDDINQTIFKSENLLKDKERQILFLKESNNEIEIENKNYLRKIIILKRKNENLISTITSKDELFKSLKNKTNENISKITSLYSDFLFVQFDISKRRLEIKKQPARKEALRINDLKKEYKHYFEQYKMMLYKYEYLLQLFPELSDYVDDFESIQKMNDITSLQGLKDDYDRVKNYISKSDYQKLDVDSRNQLALDNYIKSTKKSNWQIGRDYELMCGIEYQKDNWDVEYIGMEKKFQDMGRDLIAKKGNETHIVQCKLWSKKKIIHENHIAQLYGTTKAFGFDELNLWDVKPIFITNIELSDTAKIFAKVLEIKVVKKEFSEFPRIKCNITKDSNGNLNKIYHLPFDQQYDRTQIKNEGEFYAYTVKEAVEKGFRRAYRYNINKN